MPKNQNVSFGMADLTDPQALMRLGLQRIGNKIVSDDEEALVFGEYTNAQMQIIAKRNKKAARTKGLRQEHLLK